MHHSTLLKGIALFQILLGLTTLVFEKGSWPSVSMMTAASLVMIFAAREPINDERVELLKLKAAKWGLLFGTLGIMLIHLGAKLRQAAMPLSAFDALILLMLIVLGLFHYWRWQDGRPMPEEERRNARPGQ